MPEILPAASPAFLQDTGVLAAANGYSSNRLPAIQSTDPIGAPRGRCGFAEQVPAAINRHPIHVHPGQARMHDHFIRTSRSLSRLGEGAYKERAAWAAK